MVDIGELVKSSNSILLDTCSIILNRDGKDTFSDFDNFNFWSDAFLKNKKSFYVNSLVVDEISRGRAFWERDNVLDKEEKLKKFDNFVDKLNSNYLVNFDNFEKKRYEKVFSELEPFVSKRLEYTDYSLIVSSFVLSESRGKNFLVSNDRLLSSHFYNLHNIRDFGSSRFYSRVGFSEFVEGKIRKRKK